VCCWYARTYDGEGEIRKESEGCYYAIIDGVRRKLQEDPVETKKEGGK
jgi:hypothetical protein